MVGCSPKWTIAPQNRSLDWEAENEHTCVDYAHGVMPAFTYRIIILQTVNTKTQIKQGWVAVGSCPPLLFYLRCKSPVQKLWCCVHTVCEERMCVYFASLCITYGPVQAFNCPGVYAALLKIASPPLIKVLLATIVKGFSGSHLLWGATVDWRRAATFVCVDSQLLRLVVPCVIQTIKVHGPSLVRFSRALLMFLWNNFRRSHRNSVVNSQMKIAFMEVFEVKQQENCQMWHTYSDWIWCLWFEQTVLNTCAQVFQCKHYISGPVNTNKTVHLIPPNPGFS